MTHKVLLVVGDGAEVLDTMYPLYRLQEEGYEVVVCGPEVRQYHMVIHERPPDWDITEERPGYRINTQIAFRDINPDEYAGIVITGGRAPEYLRYYEDLLNVVRALFAARKPVAAVCHGIEIVATAGIIRGRRVTTVAKCRFDAEVCGGLYVDEPVVVSDNLITARTYHDNPHFMREFVRALRAVTQR